MSNVVTFTKGNIFDAPSEALVNPVNCVGVMGKGLALEFKRRFPNNFKEYKLACDKDEVRLGNMFITYEESTNQHIINFPTKDHWRDRSRLEYIQGGLIALRIAILDLGIESIAIPALGCGLGGLDWADVKGEIKSTLDELNCEVLVFEPFN